MKTITGQTKYFGMMRKIVTIVLQNFKSKFLGY